MGWPTLSPTDEAFDPDPYIWIDHREEEEGIVAGVSERLAPEDALTSEFDEVADAIAVTHRGQRHLIKMTFSPHDRYVMISSLAELLQEKYAFYLLDPDGDTHGLLVVTHAEAKAWGPPPPHIFPLQRGVDYFNGLPGPNNDLIIPYLNHPSPGFAAGRDVVANRTQASKAMTDAMLGMIFGGKVDDAKIREMVRAIKNDPNMPESERGKSEDEMVAELRQVFSQTLNEPAMKSGQAEIQTAMSDLHAQIMGQARDRISNATPPAPPPKPWWKFW